MIILGVDPGSKCTGIALMEKVGGDERVLDYGALTFDAGDSHPLRLKQIYERITAIIADAKPDECAIEMPVYAKNAQSLLKLGRVQAAVMLACLNREIPITQYTPKEVKKAVTGNGNATKEQVWYMVRSLLHIDEDRGLDAADALAVCLCHVHRAGTEVTKRFKDWKSFVRENPHRLK